MNSQAKAAWSAGLTVVLTAIGGALVSLEPTSWPLWLAAGSAVLSSALVTALQASSAGQPGGADRPTRGWLRRLTAATATLLALTVVSIPAALALDGSLDLGPKPPPFPSTTFTPATTTSSATSELTTETTTTTSSSGSAADEWLAGRAAQVDNPGECSYGQEEATTWNTSGTVRGPMICIDTRVRDNDYWSIIWGFRGTGVVMQIFDSSADRAYQWWNSHAELDVS
ncbi:MAG TPA: hypothetical protein VHH34_15735 [Pseudonocardiaceae bacterium]|nr:hypothetical protein [Pseudonocardiaceae bacterium]